MSENKELFICNCSSMEHHFVVDYWPDDEPLDRFVYIRVYLFSHKDIFKRAWAAIKYIFGYKCKYGHWDEVLLEREQVMELVKYLLEFEGTFSEPQPQLEVKQVKARYGTKAVRPEFPIVYSEFE